MNILINYMGREGAGNVCSYEWAKGFITNGNHIYAVISENACNADEWIDLLGESHVFLAEDYKNKNKVDFVLKTLKFTTIGHAKLRNKFKKVHFDLTLRTLYHHWAYIADKAVRPDRIVTLCHDPVNHSDEKKYIKVLYREHIKQSDDVFVLTRSFAPLVHQNYGIPNEKIHYVPHGRMNMYSNYELKKLNRPYDDKKFNFLFFGRICGYKGLQVLADAYRIVVAGRNDVSLTIVGSGSFDRYKDEYASLPNVWIENRFINDSEVQSFFTGPNIITVLPYIDATQSGVIPIAYEYETPIIASDIGGLKEQLDDGRIGMLFKAGDADALAKCMLIMISDEDFMEKQRALMRNYRTELEWDIIARRLIDELK